MLQKKNLLGKTLLHQILKQIYDFHYFNDLVFNVSKVETTIEGELNTIDYKFVANIHDEWQIEVRESQSEFTGELAVKNIIKAGEHFNLRCPMDGEYKIGDNWSETH